MKEIIIQASGLIRRTLRKDGIVISTIRPTIMAWYGKYETGIFMEGIKWRIAEGYKTEKEAIKGHKKYAKMSKEEIEKIKWIG